MSATDRLRPDYNLGTCKNLSGEGAVVLFFMDDFESRWTREERDKPRPTKYARRGDCAYFITLNKLNELDSTNEELLQYCKKSIEKYSKM